MTGNELQKPLIRKIHTLQLDNRQKIIATGITDVLSFNEQEVVMMCDQGQLVVAGEGLHISKLNLEEGQLVIEGTIDSLDYNEVTVKGGMLSRLFG